ncbi:3-hydroxyacyl-CoA dehydrogenase NAD-binding domain-containing protein [Virgibacillus sp. LDC1]|jgi:3-hydroxybutyryl-CoA dehydrogenase|uniref:3-hydroxyacyl-CoA dehydrogenase family protein n=1 Tax=Paenibacillus TaxID=44249 RepID=UPI000C2705B2|nr:MULTISPECIES: 3-hydroxyacyl-CoA dehydrogenase NAD-binding domain-containing protein [Paenibacillus]MCV4230239.1 3-hydroxyacyl-CoA dehydrogenase NAD-binding domain-containing protein [Virgibacillus sp. LDC1]MEC0254937.1 3-hydroxyacyl-CoA dehydrogenase NAD-binding domain-containing protein [Paenibacillus lautus]MEC0306671.1 3-hydroxyacyl-CoA dehydrogenase NAD-binding domain-containing protein [Paenibacillus lautus]PJN54043.1 putative 3-hydroxybutyryl-CoA dehydrogenase [Paenibacillus sp. GM2FR]
MYFKKIGVVGGGTMGQGIAEMLAAKGLDVLLVEKTPEKLDYSYRMIETSLDKQLEKWGITQAEKKLILNRIQKVTHFAELSTCDMVIETIIEDLEAKKEVFTQLDQVCPSHVILASNTSTLSLTELASSTKYPERVIGMHFIHPVSKVDLVEIIRGLKTSEHTFTETKRFVEEVSDKKGIMVYESPGFVTTRMITLMINEAMHLLQEGVASAEDIDDAMRIGYNFQHGPLEMADRFGLDSILAALERMFREYGELKYRPSIVLKKLVRAGQLGVKTGEGFFKYDKDGDRV